MALILAGCVRAPVPATAPRLVEQQIDTQEGLRYYQLFRPDSAGAGAPLVVLLHGGTGSMRKLFRDNRPDMLRWLELAEQEGFVVVVPNGLQPGNRKPAGDRQSWNDHRDGPTSVDDVAFLGVLVETLVAEEELDPDAVFFTGASNGGMMTFRMVIERPDLMAGAATFIANLPEEAVDFPAEPIPLLMLVGTDDPLIRFEGGALGRGSRGRVISADATAARWAAQNRAEPGAVTWYPDDALDDGCRLQRTDYLPAEDGAPFVYIVAEGGGHTVPVRDSGSMGWLARRLLGAQCHDASGADIAWEFFESLID